MNRDASWIAGVRVCSPFARAQRWIGGYPPIHLSTVRSLLRLRVRAALEPGRAEVDFDVVLRDVCQAGIGVRGGDRSARKLVEIDLQRGKKALQVRLLVGSEGHVAAADEREGLWKQVVAGRDDPLRRQTILLGDLAHSEGIGGAGAEHAHHV